jgi:flagellar basal body P-ring protein FlgI
MPAEPDLIEYASRVAQEIPEGAVVKFDVMSKSKKEGSKPITLKKEDFSDIRLVLHPRHNVPDQSNEQYRSHSQKETSLLARNYEMSMNVFGKFKQELMSLRLRIH